MASVYKETETDPLQHPSFSDQPHQPLEENVLQEKLDYLDVKREEYEYLIGQGEKILEKPNLLAKRLKIDLDKAKLIIQTIKPFKSHGSQANLRSEFSKIATCLEENPDIDNPEDLSLLCGVEVGIVCRYFESSPLNVNQKAAIKEKFNIGNSVPDIARLLGLSNRKVKEHVESSFLTFTCEEGKKSLQIIQKYKNIPIPKLREFIISHDLRFRNDIYIITDKEYIILKKYFLKFEESKSFFDSDMKLTMDDISLINQSSYDNLVQISDRIQKVETVIREYLEQYPPNDVVTISCTEYQKKKIQQVVADFGEDKLTFHSYRMIISNSFESMINDARLNDTPRGVFKQLLPLAFYYLKCSLPFEDITQIIANASNLILTTHDLFHIIFQLSDPVLRGFCIEHYSFSNSVPFYYPMLPSKSLNQKHTEFAICKELWYSLQQFNGLVSFGLGRAGWNPIGKSYLLDLIFETDFVKGNPQNSSFHFNSIDIQMTKNLFGKMKNTSDTESIKWAYIDCHRQTNNNIVKVICQYLDIALVHITWNDYMNNKLVLDVDIKRLLRPVKHCYYLIRDYNGIEVKIKSVKSAFTYEKYFFIPNLTRQDTNSHSVRKSLKELGYEILHLKSPKLIGSEFLESVMTKDDHQLVDILSDKRLIKRITDQVCAQALTCSQVEVSFLNYYPLFVNFMRLYYTAAFYETDQSTIENLNMESSQLEKKLRSAKMGNVVHDFKQIIFRENSALLLWKLSQELAILSKQHSQSKETTHEQKSSIYSLEIFWREALLSTKYGSASDVVRKRFIENFSFSYSNHVERGEPFELIDGDNLRFFSREIDEMLFDLYQKQIQDLELINEGNHVLIKQAPIVVSIFGPQSSGKSTLLNYCFGCKFLTSAGRCTRGIYASLSQLSRTVNLTNQFLILDTEGLDGIERSNIKDTSLIHFDRTMVLFCLAVSQVVIINVKGDIGSEMQNLLQICAYSLNKLNVRKVAAPKIFFVLNQQADPDPDKHLDSINILMDKLSREFNLIDLEGVKISDLIQVSRENLFILPSAFNSEQMNRPGTKLFDSEVIQLSPTITFADKCADLRLAIIDQLDNMPVDDRTPFQTMSEWMEMSGTIWDTIIRYQDIVKYRNVEEMMCCNLLMKILSELMENHIYCHKQEFLEITEKLSVEIQKINILGDPEYILSKYILKFDEIFIPRQEDCFTAFTSRCQNDILLKKMNVICDESRSNLSRLIYMEKKIYEDKLKFQIKAVLTEIMLSEGMKKFQEAITNNVDNYLKLNIEGQIIAFEDTWMECYGRDDQKEEKIERDESFNNLYSLFMIESKTMENKHTIYETFHASNFQTNTVISSLKSTILARFIQDPDSFGGTEQFIYSCNESNFSIKQMTPYIGKDSYEYLSPDSLFKVGMHGRFARQKIILSNWVPKECKPLVKYCSGYYSHPDIVWKKIDRKRQILLLTSHLIAPGSFPEKSLSTWQLLVDNISKKVKSFTDKDPHISPGTVKEMVNYLCFLFKAVNYEINFIQAKLTTVAERTISTLVFAYAFESLWKIKLQKRLEHKYKTEAKKNNFRQYFLQKIANRKMVRENWDREKMKESDLNISAKFARDFLESVKRGVLTAEQLEIENHFNHKKEIFSHESLLLTANLMLMTELEKDPETEVLDQENFVIKYICNRNDELRKIFADKWAKVQDEFYLCIVREIRKKFLEYIESFKQVLIALLDNLKLSSTSSGSSEYKAFDSDSNFEIADIEACKEIGFEEKRESPFKAMLMYLQMYLNPQVTPGQFQNVFKQKNFFEVDGVNIQISDTYVLCTKPIYPKYILDEEIFKKLEFTKMFTSDNIFNVYQYVTEFLAVLNTYVAELTRDEFAEMVQPIKEKFEKDAIGCPNQCPSCGKLCERELHPNDGRCMIKTGHQICSMGGKVWNYDKYNSAVLLMCDDYENNTSIVLQGRTQSWNFFKNSCGIDWDWSLPKDGKNSALQYTNREKMKNIWNKFGRGILRYYVARGTNITYVPYTSFYDVYKILQVKYYICFVIDGTMSMMTELKKVRISVGQFIKMYKVRGSVPQFKVIIYRDHCDKVLLEKFPKDNDFTPHYISIQQFLVSVEAYGGVDFPEAALDGLATAATECEWKTTIGVKNIIIHIFDAPPHGDFPNPTAHDRRSNKAHCCCCNHGTLCPFDWKTHVWDNIEKNQIKYHGINTGNSNPLFEATMKEKLGDLCGDFQMVGKEVVNEAILQIFIDHNNQF